MKRMFAGVTLAALSAIQFCPALLHAQGQAQTPLQRLQGSIERTTRSINATWGIFVKSLETGEEIAIDADRQMETMSTIKIPLMGWRCWSKSRRGSSS